MGLEISRDEFKALANDKLAAAKMLLAGSSWSNAYYLAGYAIECALKASICKNFKEHTLPDKGLIEAAYKHDLLHLINTAGLRADFDAKLATDTEFAINWAVVKDWNEKKRYQVITADEATSLVAAIEHAAHGVFDWIKGHW